jgi:hypothetical protein
MLNSAYITLIPKHDGAVHVKDFRPIILVHSAAKLITKLLANRLSQKLNDMVSLLGTDIPRVHQKDKRPHERPVGPMIREIIPSWAWERTPGEPGLGGTPSKTSTSLLSHPPGSLRFQH